jgi:histidinol phosphatase-like enzyme (inositol monophosphatase family)
MNEIDEYIQFARELAEASGEIIRKYFRMPMMVETKDDQTPVTIADCKAEGIMRKMIHKRYPDHDVVGEEYKNLESDAEYIWILDPIDGTKTFVSGSELFGTLIALTKNGRPVIGVINNPITRKFLVGDGHQAWLNRKSVQVRECLAIQDATLLTTSHWSAEQYRDGPAFDRLSRRARLYRTWGDCYGYYLVATGYADIMIDPAMHIWDVAALVPIIEGAGGVITDYYGNDAMTGEGAVATAGPLHDEVIQALNEGG